MISCFQYNSIERSSTKCSYIYMDEIANRFLSAANKVMPEMHLKQPLFTHSACGTFTKNKERI